MIRNKRSQYEQNLHVWQYKIYMTLLLYLCIWWKHYNWPCSMIDPDINIIISDLWLHQITNISSEFKRYKIMYKQYQKASTSFTFLYIKLNKWHKNKLQPFTVECPDLRETRLPTFDPSTVGSTTFLLNGEGDRLFLSGNGSGSGISSTLDGDVTFFDFFAFPSFFFSSFSFFFSFFLLLVSSCCFSTEFLSWEFLFSFSCLLSSSVNYVYVKKQYQ